MLPFLLAVALALSPVAPTKCFSHTLYTQTFAEDWNNSAGPSQFVTAGDAPVCGSVGGGAWSTAYNFGRSNVGGGDAAYYVDQRLPSPLNINPFSISQGIMSSSAVLAIGSIATAISPQLYVSGLLTTLNSFSQEYGYFEATMKLPTGNGLWSAFWMLPDCQSGQGVAELDIMESPNSVPNNSPASIYQTVHASSGSSAQIIVPISGGANNGFHRYGMLWTATSIQFYDDGVPEGGPITSITVNTPMYMILANQVGAVGSWPGAPDGGTVFPAIMQVGPVRVFQASVGSC